jgi:3-deoxy-D-manno-octulosonate 8-phosphate phosphatase (KDO 8-P phosphatase)
MRNVAAIRLLVLDVDGILTDGRIYVGPGGEDLKAFSILDGAGLVLWGRAGHLAAIISGHSSTAAETRFRRLGLQEVHVGVARKRPVLEALLARHGIRREEMAVMGDDLMDLPLFEGAGFVATTPEAHSSVLTRADHVTARRGGRGAVREVIELILHAQGRFEAAAREAWD